MKGIKGNGITLGLTDGVRLGGCFESAGSPYEITARTGAYGSSIGENVGSGDKLQYTVGITTDSIKSGIESEISYNINYVIKY